MVSLGECFNVLAIRRVALLCRLSQMEQLVGYSRKRGDDNASAVLSIDTDTFDDFKDSRRTSNRRSAKLLNFHKVCGTETHAGAILAEVKDSGAAGLHCFA